MMKLFPTGLKLRIAEYQAIQHVATDPEQWFRDALTAKITARREALIREWMPILHADSDVENLPADETALVALIIGRSDYKTRAQQDAINGESESRNSRDTYDGAAHDGATMFSAGITISDSDVDSLSAFLQNVEEWAIGALMGQVNRGKKKMIAKYRPIILADPGVETMPATDDGLITMILARDDYQRLGG
jgi:uncharacterized protein YchJ